MKKILAILLTIALLMPAAAWACEKTVTAEQSETITAILTVKTETEMTLTFTDTIYLPVTESHTIAGIKDEDGEVRCITVQRVTGKWISGCLANGWAKASLADDGSGENVAVLVIECSGELLGLTGYDNVTITIDAQYIGLALAVLQDLFGPDAALCNGMIGAGMLWWTGDYASAIFFPSYSDAFRIGTITFNAGEDTTPLMVGTFGGRLRFGLKCGWREPEPMREWVDVNVTAEAAANAQAVANAQATANAQANAGAYVNVSNSGTVDNSGDGCWRNNTVIQVNLFSIVKNCVRWIKEGCE